MTLDRNAALQLVREHVKKENNVKHMIAVGAVMRETALRLHDDPDRWDVVGILHDIDFEECTGPEDHTIVARVILQNKVDEEIIETIMAHNAEHTKVPVDTNIKRALVACDAASGLVLACALVMPSKRLADVKSSSVVKKFSSKDFAKGVSRERIATCVDLGLSLDEFLSIALEGMKKVSSELGL